MAAPTKANEQLRKRRLLQFFLGSLLLLLPLSRNLDMGVSISQTIQGHQQTLLAIDLLKTQRWSPWSSNQDGILFANRRFPPCRWANYTSQYDPTQSMPVCTHGEKDLVSSRIMQSGNWNDCHAVSRQWYAASSSSNSNIPLEIGANIGSCIWELLLASPTAQIIAFEPHPRNLFALTSTLKTAHFSLVPERVTVYPIALGTERGGTVNMVVELGDNMGSSIIERVGNNNLTIKNGLVEAETVPLERLDNILSPQQVRLAKFDIQGSECNVMDAMFPTIKPARVVAEVDAKLLEMGGCSASGLIGRLQKQDYQLFHYRHWGGLGRLPENIKRDDTAVAVSSSSATSGSGVV